MIIAGPDDQNSFIGWVECRSGFHSFSVSLITEIGVRYGQVDLRSLVVDDELGAILNPLAEKPWFKDRLENFRSARSLAVGIQNFVNEISANPQNQVVESIRESALPLLLMKHLDYIGWDRVLNVNEDLSRIQMRSIDCSGRQHDFDVLINPGYPLVCPTVQANLPIQISIPWTKTSDLRLIISILDSIIQKYNGLFQELSEIDSQTWVLEPAQQTFNTSSRRLAIERSCSIVLDINIEKPRDICAMTFFGPPGRVNSFQVSLNKNLHLWSTVMSLKENIEIVLGFKLPSRKIESSENENLCEECGICYTYSIASATSDLSSSSSAASITHFRPSSSNLNIPTVRPTVSVPDQACSNPKCCKIYHFTCLVEWLQSLPTSKTSFGTLFGSCPYCQEAISVRIQR
jgi:E3 ubiquitin-protein ligase FANCL